MKKPQAVLPEGAKAKELIALSSAEVQYIINKARTNTQEQMLRLPQVKLKIGRATSTIWKDVKEGTLPPPVALGARAVAWRESELQAWIEVKVLATRIGWSIDMPEFIHQLIKPCPPVKSDVTQGAQNG